MALLRHERHHWQGLKYLTPNWLSLCAVHKHQLASAHIWLNGVSECFRPHVLCANHFLRLPSPWHHHPHHCSHEDLLCNGSQEEGSGDGCWGKETWTTVTTHCCIPTSTTTLLPLLSLPLSSSKITQPIQICKSLPTQRSHSQPTNMDSTLSQPLLTTATSISLGTLSMLRLHSHSMGSQLIKTLTTRITDYRTPLSALNRILCD